MTSRPLLRKCFELSGVVPLGVYLVVHITSYARALYGAADFGVPSAGRPMLQAFAIALIWVPLVFHVGYGCFLIVSSPASGTGNRVQTLWLRASGLLSLAYVVFHTAEYRTELFSGERAGEDVRPLLEASLSATVRGIPLVAGLHILGLALVSVHFAIGLSRFAEGWGILQKTRAAPLARMLALLLFAAGAATIVDLATGSALPRFQD